MTFLRVMLVLAMAVTMLALGLGYMGRWLAMGDSLAVGRGWAAGALVVLAVIATLAGLRMQAFAAILVAMVTGGSVALAYVWPGPPGAFTLYQKNMLFRNSDLAGLEEDIRKVSPVAVTLQEVSDSNRALLAALTDVLPHQLYCPFTTVGGTAVATSLPPVPGGEICAPGLAAMQVQLDKRQVWIVSVHLDWPWPYEQTDHVAELLPVLARLEGPVAMAGDFNMVRWAASVGQLAAVARVQPAGPTGGSYMGFAPWLTLPIDHVFAPNGGRISFRGALGSDHLGLVAGLEL